LLRQSFDNTTMIGEDFSISSNKFQAPNATACGPNATAS
jgi:hypothetical protein